MKQIDFTKASTTSQQPLRSDSMGFMELGYVEALKTLALSLQNGSYTANTAVILYGCTVTGTPPNYIIAAGAIYFNGIVYYVPTQNVTTSGGQVLIANLIANQPTFASGGTTFTDGTINFVHNDVTAVIIAGTGGRSVTGTIAAITGNAQSVCVLPDFSTWVTLGNLLRPTYKNPTFATLAGVSQTSLVSSSSVTLGATGGSGTFTAITDIDGLLDVSSGKFTPKAGLYKISAWLNFTPSSITSAPAYADIKIYKNGSTLVSATSSMLEYSTVAYCIQINNFGIIANGTDYYTIVMDCSNTISFTGNGYLAVEAANNISM